MAGDFVSTDWIYTVEKIKFTIDGDEYPVSNLSFCHQHNGIPGIRLGLAASSRGIDSGIQSTDMAELVKYQNKIQAKVNTPGTRTALEFQLVSGADTQTVKLKRWVLQGAGIERLGVDSSVMVSALIMHPAILGRQSSLVVYNYSKEVEEPQDLGGANVYQYFTRAIREYLKKVTSDNAYADNVATVTTAMVARTNEAMSALEANVVWGVEDREGYSPYPFKGMDDDVLKPVIQSGIWNMAKIEGSNPLDSLMGMLGEFTLCLAGSFDDNPVKIVPFEPWAPGATIIYDDEINTVEMPSEDPRPIAGVVMKYTSGVSVEYAVLPPGYYINGAGQPNLDPQNTSSAGGEVSKMADLIGELVVIDPPQWLMIYLAGGVNENVEYDNDNLNVEKDLQNPGDQGAMADYEDRFPKFQQMAENYCRQHFWTLYRAGVQISLVTRFMLVNPNFKTQGNMVLPGITITMASRASGSDDNLMYFFVDRVQHIIDANAGQAYSQITGSFVRPSDGVYSTSKKVISPEEVKKGVANPLWLPSAMTAASKGRVTGGQNSVPAAAGTDTPSSGSGLTDEQKAASGLSV